MDFTIDRWLGLVLVLLTAVSSKKVLTVTSILEPPYLVELTSGENATYAGYIKDLLDELSAIIDVEYVIEVPDGQTYGAFNEDGTWSGIIGQLTRNEVDLAAGPITVTSRRAKFVDFSYPLQSVGPVIVMRRPSSDGIPITERLSRLLAPMEFTVWLMTILAFLITSTILYAIAHFNPYEWRRMARDGEATLREAESFTCLNTFWFILSTWAWQGYVRAPRSMGGRVAVTFWWLFVIIFMSCYIASLTNMLRIGPEPNEAAGYSKVRGFEDLSNQHDVNFGIIKSGSTEAFFKNSDIRYIEVLYRKMKEKPKESFFTDTQTAINKVRNTRFTNFAFIMESSMAKYYIQRGHCDLYFVSDFLVTRQYALAFPNNSMLVDAHNRALLQLHESGAVEALEQKWFSGKCKRYVYEKSRTSYEFDIFHQLDFGSFSGALFLLAVGLVFGSAITIVEIVIYRKAELGPGDDDEEDIQNEGNEVPPIQEAAASNTHLKLVDGTDTPSKGVTTV